MEETNNRVTRSSASAAPATAPRSASALASLPPLVNTTAPAGAPVSRATCSLAVSMRARAARPAPCTEDAFPHAPSAASIARRALSRRGEFALWSRYAITPLASCRHTRRRRGIRGAGGACAPQHPALQHIGQGYGFQKHFDLAP